VRKCLSRKWAVAPPRARYYPGCAPPRSCSATGRGSVTGRDRQDWHAFVTPDFLADETDPLWRFADAAMHRACFRVWDRRKSFIARHNDVARRWLAANGSYPRMTSEGTLEPCACDM